MITAIQNMWEELPLSQSYSWNVPDGCPVHIPDTITSPFERNVYLKRNFLTRLQNNQPWAYYFWIIRDWGGIKSFKDSPENRLRIDAFHAQLKKGKLTRTSHSLLSSLSKIAAFENPQAYSIYDSRSVYALNWLLFCHEKQPVLFPQPPGRNKKLMEVDTQTLFRLSGRAYSVRSHKSAYFEYCELIKDLSSKALYKTEPFYLEMLLFVAAQNWVPNDIRKRTTVKIN